MYREILLQLSENELSENIGRLAQTIEELQYCLGNLSEEKDELVATNGMLKETIQALMPPGKKKFGEYLKPIKQILNMPGQVLRK